MSLAAWRARTDTERAQLIQAATERLSARQTNHHKPRVRPQEAPRRVATPKTSLYPSEPHAALRREDSALDRFAIGTCILCGNPSPRAYLCTAHDDVTFPDDY